MQAFSIDVIAPGNHTQVARIDLCVNPGRAGDDFKAADVIGIQALAVDGHGAAINLVTLQLPACVEYRFAGGQGDVGGVDEAAAAASNAIGVGDDDLGRLARHFGVAAQLAGTAAVDFVEDDVGGAALQVRVAEDDAAQLRRLGTVGGVVEYHAVGADVVVLELVVGQATAIGGGDVYHRHAIARLADRGARRADHDAFGLGQQRLPEQRVGQDQRHATFGQAQERVTAFQGSRRLANQEGKLANIHFKFSLQLGVELQEEIHAEVDRCFALKQRGRSFQRVGKGHAGAHVLAAGEQLKGVARDAAVHFAVVATIADHALVVAHAGTVLAEHRAQPTEGHRAAPAQVIAPVAAAVAGQLLILVAAYRRRATEAHALGAEQHVFAALAGGQAGETERLAPQREGLQVADGGGVLAVARIRHARQGVMIALGVEGAGAVLHAHIDVDERTADTTTMVDAQLQFTEAVAALFEAAAIDVVVGSQVGQADVERRLAHGITVDHPLSA